MVILGFDFSTLVPLLLPAVLASLLWEFDYFPGVQGREQRLIGTHPVEAPAEKGCSPALEGLLVPGRSWGRAWMQNACWEPPKAPGCQV